MIYIVFCKICALKSFKIKSPLNLSIFCPGILVMSLSRKCRWLHRKVKFAFLVIQKCTCTLLKTICTWNESSSKTKQILFPSFFFVYFMQQEKNIGVPTSTCICFSKYESINWMLNISTEWKTAKQSSSVTRPSDVITLSRGQVTT